MTAEKTYIGKIEEYKLNDAFEAIADAISMTDSIGEIGLGDKLFQALIDLKQAFGIDLDD